MIATFRNHQFWGSYPSCKKSGVHQLRLVVYPIIYRVLAPSQVVLWDFSQGKGVTWRHPKRSFTLWIYPATHQGNSHHQDDLTFLISKSQPKPFICIHLPLLHVGWQVGRSKIAWLICLVKGFVDTTELLTVGGSMVTGCSLYRKHPFLASMFLARAWWNV